ncbi:hypothetical protein P22_1902 [Propionispora sp. 2/2-37]|uniref:hypothetical protein n=1 Tax=Propionispora sp. 2/2-37 TaxID=1677858 RepID=UPI0006BB580A|nr:hypothetical protein [Propionispora sp. 2/2-37]CUH95822.1 hypothetical protein P22_1902 [Propionispora sp. 2/2-37]
MIRVCPNCSNVDLEKLHAFLPENELTEECIGECGQHEDKSFGYIDEELVIKETEEEFINAVKAVY